MNNELNSLHVNGLIFNVDSPALIPVGEKVARSVNADLHGK
jgi:hypothetical protein